MTYLKIKFKKLNYKKKIMKNNAKNLKCKLEKIELVIKLKLKILDLLMIKWLMKFKALTFLIKNKFKKK